MNIVESLQILYLGYSFEGVTKLDNYIEMFSGYLLLTSQHFEVDIVVESVSESRGLMYRNSNLKRLRP